jgi:hypothetical protein
MQRMRPPGLTSPTEKKNSSDRAFELLYQVEKKFFVDKPSLDLLVDI